MKGCRGQVGRRSVHKESLLEQIGVIEVCPVGQTCRMSVVDQRCCG